MSSYEFDASDIDELLDRVEAYGDGAPAVINDVVHDYAGGAVRDAIHSLIPASGRSWRGKAKAASVADPFAKDDTSQALAVTVKTSSRYGYLYFPDDGSNTIRHAGEQHFFARGAEAAVPDVVDRCLAALADAFEKS